MSHELRTPLQAILGWIRMLRSGTLDDTGATRALETIERNARVQARLIEDLLDVSRIVTDKIRPDCRPVELPLVVDAAVDALRATAYVRRIRLNTLIDPAVRPIWADPDRLQQVVSNLVSNAIQFTSDGGKVDVRVEEGPPGHALVAVRDTGNGIDPACVERVFGRFSQSDRASKRLHGGLGLGLAIVRNLVELHGGTVRAESAGEGQGATFTVELPTLDATQVAAVPVESAAGTKAPRLDGLRILIVDDQPDTLEVVGAVLRHAGANVVSAGSAAEALLHLDDGVPDVLISDLAMLGEDGFQLIRKFRARGSAQGGQVPALALCAFSGPEGRRQAISAGYQLHVAKPVEPRELIRLVQTLSPAPAHWAG